MDIKEIQKAVSDFEAKLKPVTAEEKAMAAGTEVVTEEAPAPPPHADVGPFVTKMEKPAEACVDKRFKNVVVALYPQYVGKGDVPDLIKEFIDSIPECKE